MKMISAMAVLVLLAGCDAGGPIDQTIEQGVRESAVQACAAWVPQSEIAAAAGFSGQRLCNCAVERLSGGKSLSDLGELRPDSVEARAALAECVADFQSSPSDPAR